MAASPIPIFLYHSVADDPPEWLRPWSLRPTDFEAHLDLMLDRGCTPLTVSGLVDAQAKGTLPPRPVVVTFDDGYVDNLGVAAPAMATRGIVSTMYITTGVLGGRPTVDRVRLGPADMLHWNQLPELELLGVEIGAHSHRHEQLDTVRKQHLRLELELPKQLLEEQLGHTVRSLAYPYGYSSPAVRRTVAAIGYDSACGVRNAFSSAVDNRFTLARLTVLRTTPMSVIAGWLEGKEAPVAGRHELLRTRVYRPARRLIAAVRREGRPDDAAARRAAASPVKPGPKAGPEDGASARSSGVGEA